MKEKNQVKIAAFEEHEVGDPEKMYVPISYSSPAAYFTIQEALLTDQVYIGAAQSYNELPTDNPVYSSYETFLMEAFDRFSSVELQDESNEKLSFEKETNKKGSLTIPLKIINDSTRIRWSRGL